MKLFVATFLFAVVSFGVVQSKDRNNLGHKVVCYFATWTAEGGGENHFAPEQINSHVCTHINIAFARLVNNKIDFPNSGMIKRVVDLRKKNPHLTILISLGGWGDGSSKYSEMVRNAAHRQVFVHSVVEFLRSHDLDGLDFDWEFPGFTGVDGGDRQEGRAEDKHDFVTVLKELNQAFRTHGYLLTSALTTSKYNIDRAYDIANVARELTFINLMTYDFNGPWSHHAGHNSPLYPDPQKSLEDRQGTVQFAVNYFIQHGTDSKKIVVGIPLYGYGFHLTSNDHKVGAAVSKGYEGGTYRHICKQVKQPGWQTFWDDHCQVPYAVNGHEWITFDNLRSVQKKLDFVMEYHLGGAMVWEVNGDDYDNHCGDGKFPNMKLIMKTLNHVQVHD